jgi:hypothetical protein
MIDHTGIGVADVVTSAVFYDATLGALGMRRVVEMPDATDVAYGEPARNQSSTIQLQAHLCAHLVRFMRR